MEVKTKTLFRLYGRIQWLDKNDKNCYFHISKKKPLYRWAFSLGEVQFRFKKIIQDYLRKQYPQNYPLRLAHILLGLAEIEEVKRKQSIVQKQLNLFKKIKRKLS